jgi:hypothetical protein
MERTAIATVGRASTTCDADHHLSHGLNEGVPNLGSAGGNLILRTSTLYSNRSMGYLVYSVCRLSVQTSFHGPKTC